MILDLPELERIATKAFAEHEPPRLTLANLRRSYDRLSSFRTGCLVGIGPTSITVDGFTFHDELEAEGYLYELGAAMRELETEPTAPLETRTTTNVGGEHGK